jgi:hypothetical protein
LRARIKKKKKQNPLQQNKKKTKSGRGQQDLVAYNPSTQEARKEDHEFQQPGSTQGDFVSKNKNKN